MFVASYRSDRKIYPTLVFDHFFSEGEKWLLVRFAFSHSREGFANRFQYCVSKQKIFFCIITFEYLRSMNRTRSISPVGENLDTWQDESEKNSGWSNRIFIYTAVSYSDALVIFNVKYIHRQTHICFFSLSLFR